MCCLQLTGKRLGNLLGPDPTLKSGLSVRTSPNKGVRRGLARNSEQSGRRVEGEVVEKVNTVEKWKWRSGNLDREEAFGNVEIEGKTSV